MATSSALNTSNQYIKYTITITQNSQSIAANTSNVTVSVRVYRTNTGYTTRGSGTVYCKINGTTYSAGITSSQKITNSGIVLFTKTLNILHNADGTKTLACSAWISHDRFSSSEQSYNQTLSTIPRASGLSLSPASVTMGEAMAISVNRANSAFTHILQHDFQVGSWTTFATDVTTSAMLTVPIDWALRIPNSTSGRGRIRCLTYPGAGSTNSIGESIAWFTANVPECVVPGVSISVSDPTGYSASYGGYVQSKSKLSVLLTGNGAQGAAIRSYSTSVNGSVYAGASFATDVIKSSGTLSVTAQVTDSRGRVGTASKTITVLPYEAPKISKISVSRSDAAGNADSGGAYLTVGFTAAVSPLNNHNTASYTLKYKKTTETDFTSVSLSDYAGQYAVSNGIYTFAADTASSYDVVLTAADAFGADESIQVGPSITKLISIKSQGTGIAFGKIAEKNNSFECAFAMYDRFGMSIHNGLAVAGNIDPDTTTESLIVTNVNTPMGSSYYMYIQTVFDSEKSTSATRSQTAVPYNRIGSTYHRYYSSGTWSSWRRHVCADELGDYVIAQGKSGIWTYRKWNSGIAECWSIKSVETTLSLAWGSSNIYTSSDIAPEPYPFIFTTIPNENATLTNLSTTYTAQAWLGASSTSSQSTSKTATYKIMRPGSVTDQRQYRLNYYVAGSWK